MASSNAWEGGLLFAGLITYIVFLVRKSRRESQAVQAEYAEEFSATIEGWQGWVINLALVVVGLGLLVLGSVGWWRGPLLWPARWA
jgi:cation:H+ antiporter